MERNKISIIVPIYNGEKTICDTIDSLVKQTIKNIEIICVNDGSKDGSIEIIKKYAKEDKRIKVVDKKNGGVSSARNAGLEKVKTPYVMFCDDDDLFSADMCEKMLNAIEKNDVDLAACGMQIQYEAHSEIESSDEQYYRIEFVGKKRINDYIISKTDASLCNKIFKMSIIKKYGINFPEKIKNEDYYFFNAYMSIAKNIYFVNQKLYIYIRHTDSIMSDYFKKKSYSPDHLLVAMKLFEFYRKNNFMEEHKNLFWMQFSESFWFSYEHSSKEYHKKIFKLAKDFIRNNLDSYQGLNKETKRKISFLARNNFLIKIARATRRYAIRIYKKINIAYRQQKYINRKIDRLEQNIYKISDKIDEILKAD